MTSMINDSIWLLIKCLKKLWCSVCYRLNVLNFWVSAQSTHGLPAWPVSTLNWYYFRYLLWWHYTNMTRDIIEAFVWNSILHHCQKIDVSAVSNWCWLLLFAGYLNRSRPSGLLLRVLDRWVSHCLYRCQSCQQDESAIHRINQMSDLRDLRATPSDAVLDYLLLLGTWVGF